MTQIREIQYRGSLKSCNYACSYCPFAKRPGSRRELEKDEAALRRLVLGLSGRASVFKEKLGILIAPYGEALIHSYYWKEMAALSRLFFVEAVGAHACTLEQTLSQADVVSIHLPVTPQTRGLVDASWFAQMQPTAYFVNTARAAVVDQQALIDALQQKRIAGAALDVMWEEPCPKNHPLLGMDNVLITTHLGGMSQDVDKWQSAMIADEILRYANGQPPQRLWTRTE